MTKRVHINERSQIGHEGTPVFGSNIEAADGDSVILIDVEQFKWQMS